jgi:hypothetical protein
MNKTMSGNNIRIFFSFTRVTKPFMKPTMEAAPSVQTPIQFFQESFFLSR